MTPEEQFEQLTLAEREALIAKHKAETLHYGWCKSCKRKILAFGKDWPKVCPHCGYSAPTA